MRTLLMLTLLLSGCSALYIRSTAILQHPETFDTLECSADNARISGHEVKRNVEACIQRYTKLGYKVLHFEEIGH